MGGGGRRGTTLSLAAAAAATSSCQPRSTNVPANTFYSCKQTVATPTPAKLLQHCASIVLTIVSYITNVKRLTCVLTVSVTYDIHFVLATITCNYYL